jgi:hypothetical protein
MVLARKITTAAAAAAVALAVVAMAMASAGAGPAPDDDLRPGSLPQDELVPFLDENGEVQGHMTMEQMRRSVPTLRLEPGVPTRSDIYGMRDGEVVVVGQATCTMQPNGSDVECVEKVSSR